MYGELDMSMAQRWRICLGFDNYYHELYLMSLHEEDSLDLRLKSYYLPKLCILYMKDYIKCRQTCNI